MAEIVILVLTILSKIIPTDYIKDKLKKKIKYKEENSICNLNKKLNSISSKVDILYDCRVKSEQEFKNRNILNKSINSHLKNLLESCDLVDRSFILEIHNGMRSISNAAILKAEMSYEWIKEERNVESAQDDWQDIHIWQCADIMRDLSRHNDIVFYSADDFKIRNKTIYKRLKDCNAEYVALMLIRSKNPKKVELEDDIFGAVGVSICSDIKLTENNKEYILDELQKEAIEIRKLYDNLIF